MLNLNRSIASICSLSFSLVLGACGGGGSDNDGGTITLPVPNEPYVPSSPMANATTSTGIWTGTTPAGRHVTGLLQSDGSYWVFYSKVGDASVIAGAVQGTAASNNGALASTDGLDLSVETGVVRKANLNATFKPRTNLDGAVTYLGSSTQLVFNTLYDVSYDKKVSLSTLAGNYSGSTAVMNGIESASLTIDASGSLTGRSSPGGCVFTGRAIPKSEGSVFELTGKFTSGACADGNGGSTINGVGYLDPVSGTLLGAALNANRNNGMLFIGKRAGVAPSGTASAGTLTTK